VRLEVTRKLGALLALNIINLSEFSIPEKGERLAAIDTLDIHTQSHNDLVVSIRGCFIFEANFNCFI
jgi:hypothetical protein